jgi:hypothetical protein
MEQMRVEYISENSEVYNIQNIYEEKTALHYTLSHTQYLISWRIVLSEKLTGPQLVKKLPTFYGT